MREIRATLKLHFDSYLLTTRSSDETGAYGVDTVWHGTMPEVMGLGRIAAVRLDEIARRTADFDAVEDGDE